MNLDTTYTCVIIDDNEIDRLTALMYAKKYPMLRVVGVFESPQAAIPVLQQGQIDVLISDIDMPETSGLELRAQFRAIPVCIFITAYPDYAAESFDVDAFDFLVKPLKADRFDHSMMRLQSYLSLKRKAELFEYSLGGNTVFIKDGHQQVKLNLHEILYLEALKDYTRIVTPTKKYSVLASIGLLLQEQAFQSFVRIHRSYAVQKHYIERVSAQQVQVREYALPVGRSYKEALLNLKWRR